MKLRIKPHLTVGTAVIALEHIERHAEVFSTLWTRVVATETEVTLFFLLNSGNRLFLVLLDAIILNDGHHQCDEARKRVSNDEDRVVLTASKYT